jgi:2-polyprenyl-6-methoxyphenol hydroxylase-like FAD-dependent oxidoreductase
MANDLIGRRAVVVGAGMGGLAAAGALADFFEHVIVLERDRLPAGVAARPGTPQARHIHALLGGGQQALQALFPQFESDLAAAGALPLRVSADFRVELPGFDPFPQRDLGWSILSMSRPLIERVVRRQIEKRANVTLRDHCRAREFILSEERSVVGVRCESAEGATEVVEADLVVDASGRGGLTLGLLEAAGLPPPEEEVIGVDFGYARAAFTIPDDAPTDWKAVMTFSEGSRGALLLPIEGGCWLVNLAGRYEEKPPGDPEGFLRFAAELRTPTVYNAIKGAERLSDVVRYGFPESTWRHYERLASFPRGLIPFGDAMCRFNPVWGQGMTVAAQEAVLLRRLLARGDQPGELAAAFFAEAAKLIETPWQQAAIPDFALPQTTGERPPDLERRLKFGGALTRLAAEDPEVQRLMTEVRHLLKPASALRDPALIKRVEALMAEA